MGSVSTTTKSPECTSTKNMLYLTAEARIRRLKEFGVTDNEMKDAVEEVQRVRRDRDESAEPKRFVVVAKAAKPTPKRTATPLAMRRRRSWRRATTTKSRSATGPSENNSIGTRRAINKYRKYTAAVASSSKTRITTE